MNISNFDSLLQAALEQPEPQRLLLVFAESYLPEDHTEEQAERFSQGFGGALRPIVCVDKRPEELKDFEQLVKEADEHEVNWHLLFVVGLPGKDGLPPAIEDTEPILRRMALSIHAGERLKNFITFDRNGELVSFE